MGTLARMGYPHLFILQRLLNTFFFDEYVSYFFLFDGVRSVKI